MRTSEVLDRAADMIEERGWAVGTTLNEGARYYHEDAWGEMSTTTPICLEGGIIAASGLTVDGKTEYRHCDAYAAMQEYLGQNPVQERLYQWNDAKGRTPEEVIEALRGCAEKKRIEEEEMVHV